jgi:hypothetical protein
LACARVTRGSAQVRALAVVCAAACAGVLLTPLGAPYSEERPMRLMAFHVRRTVHAPGAPAADHLYWVPELDPNTAAVLDALRECPSPSPSHHSLDAERNQGDANPFLFP